MENKKITSYRDLDVYLRSYKTSIMVMKEIIPKLPESEKYDLKDQLSRSCKAVPRLIAERDLPRSIKKPVFKNI